VRRAWTTAGLVAAGIALAGCGGSAGKTSSTATVATRPSAAAGLGVLVLRPGELAGFSPQGLETATGATAFVSDEGLASGQTSEAARLNRAGFVAGAIEHLGSPGGADGLSIVNRFRTPAAASAEVATQAGQTQPGVTQTNRSVPGIPGAREFDQSSSQSDGDNIAFAVGPYYYLAGTGWPNDAPSPPTRAQLVSAAQRLYARVHR
jgi:hypothetical protein